jgi:DNA polymerase-1
MIKVAMVRVAARLRRESLAARLILQVHDELILDTPEAELDRATALVREEMEAALPLAVPVRVDVKVGATWADC